MPFHGCFGIRSLSPFHLNSLNIPIQNTECPENTEIACPDIIFSPTIFCETWTVSYLHEHAKPNLCWPVVLSMFCFVPCFVICDQSWKWTENCVISSSKHEMCFHVFHTSSLLHFRAHQALFSTSVFRAVFILNGYVLSVLIERVRNSDSETHVKKYNWTSGTNLS